MKILCAYSGIEYRVEYYPISLHTRESYHPVFDIRFDHLTESIAKCYPDQLSAKESYLGFLALLHSTRLIEFRTPAKPTAAAFAIAAQLIERTLDIIQTINPLIGVPEFTPAHFVISPDNSELQNISHVIDSWAASYKDYRDGHKRQILHDAIANREIVLQRLISNPAKSPANYSTQIAKWADIAGNFPTGTVPVNGKQIPLNEYWRSIIISCCKSENLISLNDTDLYELITHCEENIPHGSSYAQVLMRILREARDRKESYLELGDFDIKSSTYRILSDNDTVLDGNIKAMIDSAPDAKPIRANYPSQLAYVKAQFKWEAATKYAPESPNSTI